MATVVCQRIASRKSTKFSRVRFLLDSPIANQQVSHTDQERHDVTMSSWRKMEFTGVSGVNKQPQLHFRLGCSGNCTFVSLWCDYLRAKCAKENWKIVVSLLCNLCHVAVVIFTKPFDFLVLYCNTCYLMEAAVFRLPKWFGALCMLLIPIFNTGYPNASPVT